MLLPESLQDRLVHVGNCCWDLGAQSLVWGVSQVVYYGSRNQEFKIRGLRADGAGAMDTTDSGLEMSVADT